MLLFRVAGTSLNIPALSDISFSDLASMEMPALPGIRHVDFSAVEATTLLSASTLAYVDWLVWGAPLAEVYVAKTGQHHGDGIFASAKAAYAKAMEAHPTWLPEALQTFKEDVLAVCQGNDVPHGKPQAAGEPAADADATFTRD